MLSDWCIIITVKTKLYVSSYLIGALLPASSCNPLVPAALLSFAAHPVEITLTTEGWLERL